MNEQPCTLSNDTLAIKDRKCEKGFGDINNYSPKAKLILSSNYSTIFTEPEANNCFGIISELNNRK